MVNPSSQVVTSEPVLLYNTQLSPSWQTADFIVSSFFFSMHIESRVDQFLSRYNGTEHTNALCLGRSLWGRSGFMERSLAQQVRGGLEWRCSDPSTTIPRKNKTKQQLKHHNMHMTRKNSTQNIIINR